MKKDNNTYYSNQIRIIGGIWRNRKLTVLDNPNLRPTTDFMRETLFNWLSPVVQNSYCLDCFAGCGSLGLESLSRGAMKVIFLEHNIKLSKQIAKSLEVLQAKQADVITTNSLLWLLKTKDKFDIVFIDPPFRKGLVNRTISILEKHNCLSDNSWIYIETEKEELSIKIPDQWKLYRQKITRKVKYQLYIRRLKLNKQNFLCLL